MRGCFDVSKKGPTLMASKQRVDPKSETSASGPADDIPGFMEEHAGRGMESTGPTDLPWMGDDGNLDFERLLAEHGFDPLLPLEYILLAIIDAHPAEGTDESANRQARLEKALAALVGSGRR